MEIFAINTDIDSFKRITPNIDTWFEMNMAFTGGTLKYGMHLERLSPGDICLMYKNRVGIVGVGKVLEKWDGIGHDNFYYYLDGDGMPPKGLEYRIKVDWFCDLRRFPISYLKVKEELGYQLLGTLSRVVKKRKAVEELIDVARRKCE